MLGLLLSASPVAAHGELVASSPQPGETVGTASHIDLVFSTNVSDWVVSVEQPNGDSVDGTVVQKADPYLSFETKPLETEGQYIVRYSGIDSDGDILQGAYAFVVEEGAPGPAELPVDLVVLQPPTGWAWWTYALLMVGVVVVAVLTGLLAEKLRRLRSLSAAV